MSIGVKRAIVAALFLLLGSCSIYVSTPILPGLSAAEISKRLEERAHDALIKRGFGEWAQVRVDGRKAVLTGSAPSEDDLEAAPDVVRGAVLSGGWFVGGVSTVENAIELRQTVSPFTFAADLSDGRVVLSGYAPDGRTRDAIASEARRVFGPGRVANELRLAAGAPDGLNWIAGARHGLVQLQRLQRGAFTMADAAMLLDGVAGAEALQEDVIADFTTEQPLPFTAEAVVRLTAQIDDEEDMTPIDDGTVCETSFKRVLSQSRIEFATNSANIRDGAQGALDRLARVARRCSAFRFTVDGHTDDTGPRDANIQLSRDRAAQVVDFLRARGVGGDQLVPRGFGPDRPIADNTTADGRQRNRRIEFRLLDE